MGNKKGVRIPNPNPKAKANPSLGLLRYPLPLPIRLRLLLYILLLFLLLRSLPPPCPESHPRSGTSHYAAQPSVPHYLLPPFVQPVLITLAPHPPPHPCYQLQLLGNSSSLYLH